MPLSDQNKPHINYIGFNNISRPHTEKKHIHKKTRIQFSFEKKIKNVVKIRPMSSESNRAYGRTCPAA